MKRGQGKVEDSSIKTVIICSHHYQQEVSLSNLIPLLLKVKDLLQGHSSGCEAVSHFGEYDSVPQRLL